MLDTSDTPTTHARQPTIATIIAPANAWVKLSTRSEESVGNLYKLITAGRRSRERHSPEWRPANRQSGDWRTRISTSSSQINSGILVNSNLRTIPVERATRLLYRIRSNFRG